MRRIFILAMLWVMVLPLPAKKQGKQISDLLLSYMQLEDIHPDSLERNIDSLKQCRLQKKDPAAKAVYAAAIGRLYAERKSYRSVGADLLDSAVVWYGLALSDKQALAKTKAKKWKPFVIIGKDESYFDGDMLNVVWRSMVSSLERSVREKSNGLPKYGDMIAYYRDHNLRSGAFLLAMDSIYDVGYASEKGLLRLRDEYADLPICAEAYLRLGQLSHLTPAQQREWLQQGISNYPHYKRKAALQNALTNLSNPVFGWSGPSYIYPGKEYKWYFTARNVQGVTINDVEHRFPDHDPIETFRDSMLWTAPAPGDYTLSFIPQVQAKLDTKLQPLVRKIRISALQAVYQLQADGQVQIVVVDSYTGEPQADVTLAAYDPNKGDPVAYFVGQTDRLGKVVVPRCKSKYDKKRLDSTLRFKLSTPAEQHLPITSIYIYNDYTWQGVPKDSVRHAEIYTDRAIYRPGQTIHVGGIVYNQLDWESRTEKGKSHHLVLFDSNHKEVASADVHTDEMGVFATDFEIPAHCRNGLFSIRLDINTYIYIRVEEYKRPTFEVTLEDSLHVVDGGVEVRGIARNYEGTPLRGARVTGTYRWRDFWGYYRKYEGWDKTLQLDTLSTDDDGRFRYVLKAVFDEKGIVKHTLSIMVDVLSQHGETHNTSHWYWPRRDVVPTKPQPVKVDSTLLVRVTKNTFSKDNPGRIEVTTNLNDVYLYYNFTAAGKIWKEDMLKLNCETLVLDIPYEEQYDQSLTASFCFVKKGEVYTNSQTIYLERPDNKLQVHWDTFRDLLQPGQKEEWRLTLRRSDGTPADANLMVALYDASLDYFVHHGWSFDVYRSHRTYALPYHAISRNYENPRISAQYYQKLKKNRDLDFTIIDQRLFETRVYDVMLYESRGARPMMLEKSAPTALVANSRELGSGNTVRLRGTKSVETEDASEQQGETADVNENAETAGEETLAVPMRENFNETAFFYPQLRTDKDGQVAISFTLPESLTRWNLIGLAHTQDLMYASLSEKIEARKDLMAQLYLPRFLRPGDEAMLTAIVRNVGEQPQKGRALMQILDAKTEKVLKSWKADINLACKKDSVFHFPYSLASNLSSQNSDLIVRWAVEGTTCSDGEQRLLPVLPATEHVTNTIAITAYNPGVTNIDLSNIFPQGVADQRLTIEYTTHPEQYALQALPVLARTKCKDVLSLATAYYAGVLGKELEADMADSTETYLQKMCELQTEEGGFSWYPQFPASPYLTREVSYLLTRLYMLTGHNPAKAVNSRAIHYLLAQNVDSTYFSYRDLRTLYVSLWSGVTLSKDEQKKVNFLLRLAKKVDVEDMSYEGQALMALLWHKDGENRKARKFVEQFKKYLVSSPEHGTYIEFPKGSFVSVDRKLHIHVQLMEALQAVMPEEKEMLSGMRRYLLQQKRTQKWSTPVNSANAVFALLGGSNNRTQKTKLNDLLTLTRKGTAVQNFTAKEDTLGFIRDSLEIESGKLPIKLRLHKFSEGESWGSVFADFEQPFNQVTARGEGLSVRQEYPTEAKAGSRYTVRYYISADRDYEYVTLIVPRPAFTEPVNIRSGYGWCNNSLGWNGILCYYRQVHDATTEYSFYQIPRGDYLIEETLYVERDGRYHSGIAVIRCEYAEEFQGHSEDCVVKCEK